MQKNSVAQSINSSLQCFQFFNRVVQVGAVSYVDVEVFTSVLADDFKNPVHEDAFLPAVVQVPQESFRASHQWFQVHEQFCAVSLGQYFLIGKFPAHHEMSFQYF